MSSFFVLYIFIWLRSYYTDSWQKPYIISRHKPLRRISVLVFKYLTSMGVCRCSIFLVLPPLLTSLPQAFCSLGRAENCMMERNIHHSKPVPDFLMRHGNAPTYQQISSNSVHMETHPHNQMQKHKQVSMRWKKKCEKQSNLLHNGAEGLWIVTSYTVLGAWS